VGSVDGGPQARAIDQGMEDEGWRFVAFVLAGATGPLNYALGLTRTWWPHVSLGPGAFAYTWLSHAGRAFV
jgi:hypothetical protein